MLRIAKKSGSSNFNSKERITVNLDDMASMFCVLVSTYLTHFKNVYSFKGVTETKVHNMRISKHLKRTKLS